MTYADMAVTLGIDMCHDPFCGMKHEGVGTYTHDGITPTVHFQDRPITRASTLAFLRLVARADDPSLDERAPWLRVYLINVRVRALAKTLHIRNPAGAARLDRAFVLASVAGMDPEVPMRRQAYEWARHGPKRMKEEVSASPTIHRDHQPAATGGSGPVDGPQHHDPRYRQPRAGEGTLPRHVPQP